MRLSAISIPDNVPLAMDEPNLMIGHLTNGKVCAVLHYGARMAHIWVDDDELSVRSRVQNDLNAVLRVNRQAIHVLTEVA